MKKIGFIDYYISEWHANNYPKWIKEECEKTGLNYEVAYFWAEKDVSPVDNVTSDEWAKTTGITRVKTIEELCEKSDVIIILAPSNPEKHLLYAQKVLPYKKHTYIDKTFAPDVKTAKEIFAIAEEYGTPFFSSSALRYADEINEFTNVKNIIIMGGGRDFDEYIIHNCEMAIALLKSHVVNVKAEKIGKQYFCRAKTADKNEIGIVFSRRIGYSITAEDLNGELLHRDIKSPFFNNLIADMLRFFEDGKTSFDTKETIEVMQMREALIKATKQDNVWLDV